MWGSNDVTALRVFARQQDLLAFEYEGREYRWLRWEREDTGACDKYFSDILRDAEDAELRAARDASERAARIARRMAGEGAQEVHKYPARVALVRRLVRRLQGNLDVFLQLEEYIDKFDSPATRENPVPSQHLVFDIMKGFGVHMHTDNLSDIEEWVKTHPRFYAYRGRGEGAYLV